MDALGIDSILLNSAIGGRKMIGDYRAVNLTNSSYEYTFGLEERFNLFYLWHTTNTWEILRPAIRKTVKQISVNGSNYTISISHDNTTIKITGPNFGGAGSPYIYKTTIELWYIAIF